MADKFYIITAIDYTNSPPHIGHAYEKRLKDPVGPRFFYSRYIYLAWTVGEEDSADIRIAKSTDEGRTFM